ncbi:MAG: hypothetical protein MjAS7_1969 [Metallosphaera javensis (ex Sakai et al. 2022)]|nr:MAG: hypothetical protein MjAS7_1969 [Metallosphaera javensis (ex Sakai et al. 2022)]
MISTDNSSNMFQTLKGSLQTLPGSQVCVDRHRFQTLKGSLQTPVKLPLSPFYVSRFKPSKDLYKHGEYYLFLNRCDEFQTLKGSLQTYPYGKYRYVEQPPVSNPQRISTNLNSQPMAGSREGVSNPQRISTNFQGRA